MLAAITAVRAEFPNAASATAWFSDSAIMTTWSTTALLSCRATNDHYTGGAHGNHQAIAIILDLGAQRILTLDDLIIPPNQPALSALLTQAYKQAHQISASDGLRLHGLNIDVLPVRLPIVTAAGNTVIYPPYDIASYAAGTIIVDLPRNLIRPLLTRDLWANAE